MNYKTIKIMNADNNQIIGDKIKVADSFVKRFRGLMLSHELNENEGMLIKPCNSIHMMFMRYPIDAVFLDSENKVKAVYENLKPWIGITKMHSDVTSVLELKSGRANQTGIINGNILTIEETV
ncbi:MAG: DUF192 domain-containing protein [Candidatus Ozemobacteraceae bacterium]|jgi:uncharacterized protein|nr:DUF192 domain-containing protein [Candidatus Riflebacteria bacterium]